ncbi:MAG: Fic family protein [Syntrophales bacterium]
MDPMRIFISSVQKEFAAERLGTGIRDMVTRYRAAGLPEPEFKITDGFVVTLRRKPGAAFESMGGVTAQATAEVTAQVVVFCSEPQSAKEVMTALRLKHWKTFQANYLNPLLVAGILERTIPDKPQSPRQKYRLTQKDKILRTVGETE